MDTPTATAPTGTDPTEKWSSLCHEALREANEALGAVFTQTAAAFDRHHDHSQFQDRGLGMTPNAFRRYIIEPLRKQLGDLADPLDRATATLGDSGAFGRPSREYRKWMQHAYTKAYAQRQQAILQAELAVLGHIDTGLKPPAPNALNVASHAAPSTATGGGTTAALTVQSDGEPTQSAPTLAAVLRDAAATVRAPLPSDESAPTDVEWAADTPEEEQAIDLGDWVATLQTKARDLLTQTTNRLTVLDELLGLHDTVQTHANDLLSLAWQKGIQPTSDGLTSAATSLRDKLPALEQLFLSGAAPDILLRLKELRAPITGTLERQLSRLAASIVAVDLNALSGTETWHAVVASLEHLPQERQVHAIRDDGTLGDEVEVDLREAAIDALAPPWPQQLAKAASALQQRLLQIGDESEQALDIVRYNIDAAVDELETPDDKSEQLAAAKELAITGVQRASDHLEALQESIQPEWEGLYAALTEAVLDDWGAVRRRTQVRDQVAERFVGWQTRLQRYGEHLRFRLRQKSKKGLEQAKRLSTVGLGHVRRLIQRGRSAVGVPGGDAIDGWTALQPLRDIQTVHDTLPRVYRRLFTLEPLDEPALALDLDSHGAWAKEQANRWVAGDGSNVLAFVAAPGGGRTTLFENLSFDGLKNIDVHRWTMTDRPGSASTFAQHAGSACGLHDVTDLPSLNRSLSASSTVCFVDDAEHLVHQALGAGEMTHAVMQSFAANTRTLWVLFISSGAWHYLERALPDVARAAMVRHLPPLDRHGIETLVMHRHKRSGLPLHFSPPDSPSAILRQRLRRAHSEERRQLILREYFFDTLDRAAGQSPELAIAYWIRAADFNASPGELTIRPFQSVDTKFLEVLPMDHQFALRAFLIHGTLTATELAATLRMSHAPGVTLAQNLSSMGLLVRAGETPDRLRILPLARAPISEFLRRRNLVYHH